MNGPAMDEYEEPLDPARPIIDPHLHHWEILPSPELPQAPQRFLLPEAVATIAASGHNITHTVFVECHAMYRQEGPPALRVIGESEFANGIAAMSASGGYGPCRFAHRIVGSADLLLGAAVAPVLEAHRAAAGDRFRGVRFPVAYSDRGMFGLPADSSRRALMHDARLQEGARVLARMGLSLDVWCLHHQLEELIALTDAVPDLTVILDHVGTPDYRGSQPRQREVIFDQWRRALGALARRPNVFIKLGGLGMEFDARVGSSHGTARSAQLAEAWRPHITAAIEAFSPARCMFESNFPPDRAAGSYGAIWNAFKRLAREYSASEQEQLFRGTAAAVYAIDAASTPSPDDHLSRSFGS